MIRIYCDGCGKEITDQEHHTTIPDNTPPTDEIKHLCSSCYAYCECVDWGQTVKEIIKILCRKNWAAGDPLCSEYPRFIIQAKPYPSN